MTTKVVTSSRSRSFTISSSIVVAISGSRPVIGSSNSSRLRLRRHRPGNADAAALAARERRRHAVGELAQADEAEHLVDARIDLLLGQLALFAQTEADVLRHRQRVEQRVFLEHHADVGAHLQEIELRHLIDALAVDENRAFVRAQQAERQLEDDRLAGAAGAEQDAHVAFRHGEAEIAKHDVIVESERDALEGDRVQILRLSYAQCSTA